MTDPPPPSPGRRDCRMRDEGAGGIVSLAGNHWQYPVFPRGRGIKYLPRRNKEFLTWGSRSHLTGNEGEGGTGYRGARFSKLALGLAGQCNQRNGQYSPLSPPFFLLFRVEKFERVVARIRIRRRFVASDK